MSLWGNGWLYGPLITLATWQSLNLIVRHWCRLFILFANTLIFSNRGQFHGVIIILQGGFGIMFDDVLAGLAAGGVMWFIVNGGC